MSAPTIQIPNSTTENVRLVTGVIPGIYRGGQPDDAGWNWLKAQGVIRVVKLNLECEGTDVAAEALGMTLFYHPIDKVEQLVFRPKYDEVKAAVGVIQPGTYIHCEHGEDRTGLVVACYRVWSGGWNKELAEKEMDDCGFHWELLGLELFWEWAV
jgi:tyrosine-protein phosphatase SIW14